MKEFPIFYQRFGCGRCYEPKICLSVNVTVNAGGETSTDYICTDCIVVLSKDPQEHLATGPLVKKPMLTLIK